MLTQSRRRPPLTGPGALPGVEPADGDAGLIHAVIAAGGQDPRTAAKDRRPVQAQVPGPRPGGPGRGSTSWGPAALRDKVTSAWGPPAGDCTWTGLAESPTASSCWPR